MLQAVLSANEPTVVEEDELPRAHEPAHARRFASHEAEEQFPVEAWAEGPS